ncbi:MAG: hypothetical protein OHK006_06400 [Thermodesulfovibrionales bacterium]
MPVVVVSLLTVTLFSLDRYGKHVRGMDADSLAKGAPEVISVEHPVEAFYAWAGKGFRGRVVVSVSSRLYFVMPAADIIPARMRFPLTPANPAVTAAQDVRSEDFLRVAMETGIAREIVHIVPDPVFAEKLRPATQVEGATVTDNVIHYPYFGSPRSIRTFRGVVSREEPALVFIDASATRYLNAEGLYQALKGAGIRTAFVVTSLSSGDPEVSDVERQELKKFVSLLARGG